MDETQKFDLIIQAIVEARKKHPDFFVVLEVDPPPKLASEGLSALEIASTLTKQQPSIGSDGRLRGTLRAAVLQTLEEFQRHARVIELSPANYPATTSDRKIIAYRTTDHKTGEEGPWISPEEFAKTGVAISEDHPAHEFLTKKICLSILTGFDNWLASYRLRTQDDLERITPITLAKVCCTVLDISEKLEASGQPLLQINARFQHASPFFPQSFVPTQYRQDAFDYMKNKGVVMWFEITYLAGNGVDASYIKLTIDIPKFQEFKARVCAVYTAKEQAQFPPKPPEKPQPQADFSSSDTDVVYTVQLTGAREVLINNFQLTQMDFSGENEIVFTYIYEHANTPIPVSDLDKLMGSDGLKKKPRKIIENVGFTRELLKAFFDISKTNVCFHNPLRKEELQQRIGVLACS